MQIREDLAPLKRRSVVILGAAFLALGVLLLRLVELQLLEAGMWRQRAENNRLRRIPLTAQRGVIYDRRGEILADNLPTWDLLLFPDEARDLDRTVLFLARSGVVDVRELRHRLEVRRVGRLAPLVAAEDLSWEQVARVRSHQSDHPELAVISGFRRFYPQGGIAAHAVGHLRLVSQREVTADPTLDANTLIGATGIETLRNEFLSGQDGERFVVVSAVGRQLGIVQERPAIAGRDLGVTLDLALQRVAARALGDNAGSVVALEPSTGAVRVLYSSPSFDPNIFVGRLSRLEWKLLAEDPGHPLEDRSIRGIYPPGSTIKPFLALAALSEDLVSPSWRITCQGSVVLHGHRFRCWRRGGHGRVALVRSIEVSCDSYYYLLGQRLGIEGIAEWLGRFRFGSQTGIGLATEASGLIGTPEWSRRVRGTPWYPGEVVSMSIGQGPLLVTPLQLARGFAVLANGGRMVTPYLVELSETPQPRERIVDPDDLALVTEGLERVVHGTEGTARSLSRLPAAGKTGTAQVARLQEGIASEDLPPELQHHAWFVGWVPLAKPQLVVAVIVEHGGGGGGVAAPVARAVFEAALQGVER
jgi:penicillin-binding protein 2